MKPLVLVVTIFLALGGGAWLIKQAAVPFPAGMIGIAAVVILVGFYAWHQITK